jgi:hypothetical protein
MYFKEKTAFILLLALYDRIFTIFAQNINNATTELQIAQIKQNIET